MKQKFLMPTGDTIEKEMPLWKTPWNHDRDFESERTATFTPEDSLTKQEFKEEVDINVLLDRFLKTGQPPPIVMPEDFADLTGRTSYFDMASRTAEVNELFYLLPAKERAEHLNDPARWADAVVLAYEHGNVAALNKLGIAATEKPQEPKTPDPLGSGTPADKTGQTASAAPKQGDTPKPPSDNTGK